MFATFNTFIQHNPFVEGGIGVAAAGFRGVVASCGTALTADQVRAVKRHTDKMVVNFDPDAAGEKDSSVSGDRERAGWACSNAPPRLLQQPRI